MTFESKAVQPVDIDHLPLGFPKGLGQRTRCGRIQHTHVPVEDDDGDGDGDVLDGILLRVRDHPGAGAEEQEPVSGVLTKVRRHIGFPECTADLLVHHLHRTELPVEDRLHWR